MVHCLEIDLTAKANIQDKYLFQSCSLFVLAFKHYFLNHFINSLRILYNAFRSYSPSPLVPSKYFPSYQLTNFPSSFMFSNQIRLFGATLIISYVVEPSTELGSTTLKNSDSFNAAIKFAQLHSLGRKHMNHFFLHTLVFTWLDFVKVL